ncbi:MAG TPA: twin-arginine translocation signal domain-containing protein, partial [Mycobacterium sp.]
MTSMSRRAVLATLGAGGVALALGYVIRGFGRPSPPIEFADGGGDGGMMGSGMMGNAGPADMRLYMDMFNRHNEITRVVEEMPGGVRTTTQSSSPEL